MPSSRPLIFLIWQVLLLVAAPAFGQTRDVPEYQLKAAFLHRFASFVDWPGAVREDSTFTIGVLGDDPFGDALRVIESKTVAGQPIQVRRFSKLADLEPTHILFVSRSEDNELAQVFEAVLLIVKFLLSLVFGLFLV